MNDIEIIFSLLQLQLTLPVEAIERYWNQNERKTHESEYFVVRHSDDERKKI